MEKKKAYGVLATTVMAFLFMPAIAFARNSTPNRFGSNSITASNTIAKLQHRYEIFACDSNFESVYGNDVIAVTHNSLIGPQLASLENDTKTLWSWASSGNASKFRSFLHDTYKPQLRLTRRTINRAVEGAHLNKNQTATLKRDRRSAILQARLCKARASAEERHESSMAQRHEEEHGETS